MPPIQGYSTVLFFYCKIQGRIQYELELTTYSPLRHEETTICRHIHIPGTYGVHTKALQSRLGNLGYAMSNPTKIDENSIKNPSKIYQKSMKMRSMGASWGDFGGIWGHVG